MNKEVHREYDMKRSKNTKGREGEKVLGVLVSSDLVFCFTFVMK